jgi:hypothetical protein
MEHITPSPEPGNRRVFKDMKSFGHGFFSDRESRFRTKIVNRYPHLPAEMVEAAARKAVNLGRKFDTLAAKDERAIIKKAASIVVRHELLRSDKLMDGIARRSNRSRLPPDQYLFMKRELSKTTDRLLRLLATGGS